MTRTQERAAALGMTVPEYARWRHRLKLDYASMLPLVKQPKTALPLLWAALQNTHAVVHEGA